VRVRRRQRVVGDHDRRAVYVVGSSGQTTPVGIVHSGPVAAVGTAQLL